MKSKKNKSLKAGKIKNIKSRKNAVASENEPEFSLKSKTAALVFDRFYRGETSVFRVVAQRVLIAAALSFLCIGFVFLNTGLPTGGVPLAVISAGFAVLFSIAFQFAGRRVSIIIALLLCGVLILWRFDAFWERFSYFVDGVMLQFNGRLFDTTPYLIHPLEMLEHNGLAVAGYSKGVIFGCVIVCALFGMITAAGLVGKPCIFPSVVMFIVMWSPKLGSERLLFDWRLIPIMALYAGALAIGVYYRDGLVIRHVYVAGGYRRKVTADRKRFNMSLRSQSAEQRAVSRGLYYSKYFSSVISAAAMFAVLGIVINIVFSDSVGIDYQALFEKIQSIESPFGTIEGEPFKRGAEANYFSSPKNSVYGSNNRLRLSAPSRSNKEILRVTKPISSVPLYLRGDIGIDFDGESWSSPITEEPPEWSEFRGKWLPVEMSGLENNSVMRYMNAEVEYLCDTDVVFVPAYDGEFSVFKDDTVSVFGDFAVRRGSDKAVGDKRKYSVMAPQYTDGSSEFMEWTMPQLLVKFTSQPHYGADSYVDMILSDKLVSVYPQEAPASEDRPFYEDYVSYVSGKYLSLPEELKPRLEEFIAGAGIDEIKRSAEENAQMITASSGYYFSDPAPEPLKRYLISKGLSEYLKENYTYSLDAHIDSRDPVMSFLTNTKSGHCALYASAMTLILRDWGVPARYCTGFAASADLSVHTLRSKDLHAWCEVYLDELGWVTFDPTASAIFDGIVVDSTPTGSGSSEEQSGSRTESGMSSLQIPDGDFPDDPDDDDNNTHGLSGTPADGPAGFNDVLPYVLRVLGILAAAALLVFMIVAYNGLKKRAYKKIQQFRREENSDFVYAKMIAVLRLCKLVPQSGEQPHEFFERAEETLKCQICEYYGLFERLAFGSAELDTSERAMLGGAFEKIYRAAERKLLFPRKIRLRILILNKKV